LNFVEKCLELYAEDTTMEVMLEDTQEILSQAIFRGGIPMRSTESNVHHVQPGKSLTITCTPAPHMVLAARVCKMWRDDFKKYLAPELEACMQTVWKAGANDALALCDCDEYHHHWSIPPTTTVMYSMWRCREYVFSEKFTRRHTNHQGGHELVAQYAVPVMPGRMGVSTHHTQCPAVCWVPGPQCSLPQIAEFQHWRIEQTLAMQLWLSTQQAELNAAPTPTAA
jgi:hypothetical protein